jgi:hypothetical protein
MCWTRSRPSSGALVMKIVPLETSPPGIVRRRRHTPRAGGYTSYRPCLRWDFGFTCAICLLHESDLAHCVDGTGLTSIEHFVPKSTEAGAEQRDDYGSCLYVCRFCNGARGRRPNVSDSGACLLDPTRTVWSEHFTLVHARLDPREDDVDAEYTSETYDLNDPRRITMRNQRWRLLSDRIELMTKGPELLHQLYELIEGSKSPERALQAIEHAVFLRERIHNAWLDLERFVLVPIDAPETCRCETTEHRCLPPDIERSGLELGLLTGT